MDNQSRLMLDLFMAFNGAPSLSEAFGRAYPLLKQLVPADHGALCLIHEGEAGTFDWATAELPETFFRPYDEMVGEDFVFAAVSRAPDRALRDEEMGQRSDLEKSSWHRYVRDLKLPIEHLMASMLSIEPGWKGGLVLYRDRKTSFTDSERALFQELLAPLATTLGNCRRIWSMQQNYTTLETVMGMAGLEAIIFSPAGREVARTQGASKLIEQWYPPTIPRGRGGVPERLLERIKEARKSCPLPPGEVEILESVRGSLQVSILPITEKGRTSWALLFEESAPEIPRECLVRLSTRQREVVRCVLHGWENKTIAEHLGVEVGTVKKHLQHIFDALGVSSRAALIARCWRKR